MCGIASFLGNNNKTPDLLKLKLTSIANDSRGGHGVGVWANLPNSFLMKDIQHSNFSEFYESVHFKNKTTAATCVISHTRYATKGSKTNENLHPFVLGNGKFVFCHNGTIYNILELVKKYPIDIDTTDKVDSFLLANIIYKYGYDVLKEYRGKAALVWTDNGGETLKVFKGESLSNLNVLSEERPLYGVYLNEGLYLSSVKRGLAFICSAQENQEIFDIANNCIFEFKDNKVISSVIIDRSNSFQEEEKISYSSGYSSQGWWDSTNYSNSRPVNKDKELVILSDKFKLKFENGYFKTQFKSELLHGVYQTDEKVRKFNRLTKFPEGFNTNPTDFPYLLIFNKGLWINVESWNLKQKFINNKTEFTVTNILNLLITENQAEYFSLVPVKYFNSWYRPNKNATEFALPPMFSETLKYKDSNNSVTTLSSLKSTDKQLTLPFRLSERDSDNPFDDEMVDNSFVYDLETAKTWYSENFSISYDLLTILLNKGLSRYEIYNIINASSLFKAEFFDLMIDLTNCIPNSQCQEFSSTMFNLAMNEINSKKSLASALEEFLVEQYILFEEEEEEDFDHHSVLAERPNLFPDDMDIDPEFEHFSNFNH